MIAASCSTRERFLEAIQHLTERELAGPGAPGTVDEAGWQKVERREAQRPPSMGARGSVYRARWVR